MCCVPVPYDPCVPYIVYPRPYVRWYGYPDWWCYPPAPDPRDTALEELKERLAKLRRENEELRERNRVEKRRSDRW